MWGEVQAAQGKSCLRQELLKQDRSHPASSSSPTNILPGGHFLPLRVFGGLHPHNTALAFLPSQSGKICCPVGWAPRLVSQKTMTETDVLNSLALQRAWASSLMDRCPQERSVGLREQGLLGVVVLVVHSFLGTSPGGRCRGWKLLHSCHGNRPLLFPLLTPQPARRLQVGGAGSQVRCRLRQCGSSDWAARQSPQVLRAPAGGKTWP